jgi:putative transposase
MSHHLSHKIRLYPTPEQELYLAKAAGTARFAYNWAKNKNQELYSKGEKSTAYSMTAMWNAWRKENAAWSYEVTKWAGQRGVQNFYEALGNFFAKRSSYPRYKSKHKDRPTFYVGVGEFKTQAKSIKLPNLGWVAMAQELRFPGKQLSVVISKDVDQWYASVAVELDSECKYKHLCQRPDEVVGVDLGVGEHFAVLSTGEKIANPRTFRRNERRVQRLNKSLSRKKKGSKNRDRAKQKLAKEHRRIRRKRQDFLHKTTTSLVERFGKIGIETLNLKGMVKTKLSKSVQDASLFEFRRQLEYKARLAGVTVVKADRFYPSSKTCSSCGFKLEVLELGTREWICPSCNAKHDRDINAAINLMNLAVRYTDNNACGDEVRLPAPRVQKHLSAKQESKLVCSQ